MNYTVINGVSKFETNDVSEIEQMLRVKPCLETTRIEFELPIPLEAMVRRIGDTEEVLLCSGEAMRTLTRNTTANEDGDLCVSCSPDGAEVDVSMINLPFRGYDDTLTDRGHVWVVPGQPAVAFLELKPQQFGESNESIADIIAAAEAAVQARVLGHFAN